MRSINLGLKRTGDMLGSGLGDNCIIPLFLVVSVLIKIFMPGPVLFRSAANWKKRERSFTYLKFRSMKVDKQARTVHDFTKERRKTERLGKVIRRTK